jgi:ribosomal protein S18 acetylase RimI-like enzyme
VTLTVREAGPDEFEAAGALTVAAYEEYAEDLGTESWATYRASLADVARRAERGRILVAEEEGVLLGVVSYYPPIWDKAEAITWDGGWWPPDFAYFRALGVHPAARGRGIGRALTLACIGHAKEDGAAGIALNTTSVMPVAQAMYERLGFRLVPNDVWDGPEDRWRLYCYQVAFPENPGAPGGSRATAAAQARGTH